MIKDRFQDITANSSAWLAEQRKRDWKKIGRTVFVAGVIIAGNTGLMGYLLHLNAKISLLEAEAGMLVKTSEALINQTIERRWENCLNAGLAMSAPVEVIDEVCNADREKQAHQWNSFISAVQAGSNPSFPPDQK